MKKALYIIIGITFSLAGCYYNQGRYIINGQVFSSLDEAAKNAKSNEDFQDLQKQAGNSFSQYEILRKYWPKWYVESHPNLPEITKKAILESKLIMGLSKEQVLAAAGSPIRIHKMYNNYGTSEQWVYGYSDAGSYEIYLYFDNDKLTNVQY
jgi:hypothetical protein